jgi:hypothetical protein
MFKYYQGNSPLFLYILFSLSLSCSIVGLPMEISIIYLTFLLVYIISIYCIGFLVTFSFIHTMYPSLIHPPLFIFFPLPLLKMFHIHTCTENTSTIFTLFIYPPPLISFLQLP